MKLLNRSQFIILVLCVFGSNFLLSAQNRKIESYKDSVENTANDSLKVTYLIKLSREIHRSEHDRDLEYNYANKAVELALHLKDSLLYAKALDNLGLLHRFHNQYKQAFELHRKAFQHIENKEIAPIHKMIFANNAGVASRYNQNYDQAVEFYLKALKIAEQENDLKNIAIASNGLGNTLTHIPGREEETITYFERSLQAEKDRNNDLGVAMNYLSIGDFYTKRKEFNQAKKVLYELLDLNNQREDQYGIAITEEFLGIAYLEEGVSLNQAVKYLNRSFKKFEDFKNTHKQAELLALLAAAYFELNQISKAEDYYEQSFQLSKNNNQFGLIQSTAYKLSRLAEENGNHKTALRYYKTAKAYEDSLEMNEQKVKIEALTKAFDLEKKENKIELLEKEKALQIAEVNAQKDQLAKRKLTTIILSTAFGFAVLLFFLQYRNFKVRKKVNEQLAEEEKQKLNAVYEKNLAQAEILVSRLQVNPHFLFNSLNAITYLMQSGQNAKAIKYLKIFSKYTRKVLETSKEQLISLKEELQLAQYYLQLEENRFEKDFIIEVNGLENSGVDGVWIPPILLQPFLENAIWHGLLLSKKETKKLSINVEFENQSTKVYIDDNGVGRGFKGSKKSSSKRKSMGMQITKERIALYNKTHQNKIHLAVIDKKDEDQNALGTQVVITIEKSKVS